MTRVPGAGGATSGAEDPTLPGVGELVGLRADPLPPIPSDLSSLTHLWTHGGRAFSITDPLDSGSVPFLLLGPRALSRDERELIVAGETVRLNRLPAPAGDLGPSFDWIAGRGTTLPDPGNPLETFRRALLIRRGLSGAESIPPPGPRLADLARYNAVRWAAGFERLQVESPDLVEPLLKALTRQCQDGVVTFAAWPPSGARLAQLESALLDANLNPSQRRSVIERWIAELPDLVSWIESDHGDEAHVAVANLSNATVTADLRWVGRPEPPWPLTIRPGYVARAVVPKPAGSGPMTLSVGAGRRQRVELPVVAGPTPVAVPGAGVGTFVQAWRHDSWYEAQPAAAPGTTVSLRLGPEGWELFVRMHRPGGARRTGAGALSSATTFDHLVGREALTIFVGPRDNPIACFSIAPDGAVREWRPATEQSTIAVRDRGDQWVALVRLPEAWTRDGVIDLGFLRTHGGLAALDASPRPCLPWRPDPGRIRFDLSAWDRLPSPPPLNPSST